MIADGAVTLVGLELQVPLRRSFPGQACRSEFSCNLAKFGPPTGVYTSHDAMAISVDEWSHFPSFG